MKRNLIIEIIAALLILLFVYAAVMKLSDYHQFKDQLEHSPQLYLYAGFISWSIPLAELLIALMLTLQKTRFTGLILSLLLMLAFTIYVSYVLYFARQVPCACGGVLSRMTWKQHFIFNLIYTGIALAGVLIYKKYSYAQKNRASRKPVTE